MKSNGKTDFNNKDYIHSGCHQIMEEDNNILKKNKERWWI